MDWKKGCLVGQELTARTRHRALIRKRLLRVRIEGPDWMRRFTPAPGESPTGRA